MRHGSFAEELLGIDLVLPSDHSEMQMSSTPAVRSLDAENSSRGSAITSAAGRKSSQAPRDARPRLSPGEHTTAHSRRFTADPAAPMAEITASRQGLPPELSLPSSAEASSSPAGPITNASPGWPRAISADAMLLAAATASIVWALRGGIAPMSAAQSQGYRSPNFFMHATTAGAASRTIFMPGSDSRSSSGPLNDWDSAMQHALRPASCMAWMVLVHMMHGLNEVQKTALAQSTLAKSTMFRHADVSP